MATKPSKWKCLNCKALNSPNRVTCKKCGNHQVWPEDEEDEDDRPKTLRLRPGQKPIRKPLRVNFKENEWDALAKELGKKHLFATTISKELGGRLSPGQVRYRLRKGGITIPLDYRQGRGGAANAVIKEAWAKIKRMETILRECRELRRV
jgi:ribosomal protein L40E